MRLIGWGYNQQINSIKIPSFWSIKRRDYFNRTQEHSVSIQAKPQPVNLRAQYDQSIPWYYYSHSNNHVTYNVEFGSKMFLEKEMYLSRLINSIISDKSIVVWVSQAFTRDANNRTPDKWTTTPPHLLFPYIHNNAPFEDFCACPFMAF